MVAAQFGIFKLQQIEVPSVPGAHRLRGASNHRIGLPSGHPPLEALKGGHPPQPIANRQDRQTSKPFGIEIVFTFAKKGCAGDVGARGPGHPSFKLLEEQGKPFQRFIG